MSAKPIPAVGLRAWRILTAEYDRQRSALDAQYQKDTEDLGDDILAVMGVELPSTVHTVCYPDGVVTGFPDLDVAAILRQTVAKLEAERPPEATPIVIDGVQVPHANGVRKVRKPRSRVVVP